MNMHKDHTATCMCCKHFDFDSGSPGYSELTPGTDPSIGCRVTKTLSGMFYGYKGNNLHDLQEICQQCIWYEPRD